MALVRSPVELHEVVVILKRRGYGEVSNRRFGLALNRATGKFYQSGGEIRETIGGISHDQLRQILLHAETPEQAATAIENTVLGKEMLPIDRVKEEPTGSSLSADVVERMVTARVANEVAKIAAPIQQQMQETLREMKDFVNRLTATAPAKKKPGRPPKKKVEEPVTYADLPTRSSQVPPDAV